MPFDLYVWERPRDLDGDATAELLDQWERDGADPPAAPFEPSVSVAWFHRELRRAVPDLDLTTDARSVDPGGPIWLAGDDPEPARIVAIRLPPAPDAALDEVFGLAAKYDLVVFDPHDRQIHAPLAEMAAYADATFWPGGAIQAALAGAGGLALAIVAWIMSIPILSGVGIVVGGFLVVMAVFTFVHHLRAGTRS